MLSTARSAAEYHTPRLGAIQISNCLNVRLPSRREISLGTAFECLRLAHFLDFIQCLLQNLLRPTAATKFGLNVRQCGHFWDRTNVKVRMSDFAKKCPRIPASNRQSTKELAICILSQEDRVFLKVFFFKASFFEEHSMLSIQSPRHINPPYKPSR